MIKVPIFSADDTYMYNTDSNSKLPLAAKWWIIWWCKCNHTKTKGTLSPTVLLCELHTTIQYPVGWVKHSANSKGVCKFSDWDPLNALCIITTAHHIVRKYRECMWIGFYSEDVVIVVEHLINGEACAACCFGGN